MAPEHEQTELGTQRPVEKRGLASSPPKADQKSVQNKLLRGAYSPFSTGFSEFSLATSCRAAAICASEKYGSSSTPPTCSIFFSDSLSQLILSIMCHAAACAVPESSSPRPTAINNCRSAGSPV